ncbi:MAG: ATP-binding cassette domain-containing protein [Candidatus Cloacimonetes bacterium]|nr:ATP-binding cassette domain-containing protein [Candidatus Cloacimonadota bacterium]
MLKINNFKLISSKQIILSIADLSLELGTFTYIHGTNSTGKSLFLKTLIGQYKNFSGEITFKKQPLSSLKNSVLLLNNELPVIKKLDYIENIKFSLGKLGNVQNNRLVEMASILGITNILKNKMEFSSRSERMCMYIIRAALISPSILLIDDFDDYFDDNLFQRIYQVISLCLKSGMLIISTGKSSAVNNTTFSIISGELKRV